MNIAPPPSRIIVGNFIRQEIMGKEIAWLRRLKVLNTDTLLSIQELAGL